MKAASLLTPKLFYFFWFASIGVYSPYITLYYRDHALSLSQIGVLLALPGLAQLVAGPLWGLLADALGRHRILLPIAILGAVLPATLIKFMPEYAGIFVLAALAALFMVPIAPLSDSATLALLGERRDLYGVQRMWGAVGWGTSTIVSGLIVDRLGLPIIFVLFPIMGSLAMLMASLLPRPTLARVSVPEATGVLLRDGRWLRFLGGALLIGCASTLTHGFLSIYLSDLGAGNNQIGLAYTIASISEVPAMALAPMALRRWGARKVLAMAGLAFVLRLSLYIIAPSTIWALAIQLLHGLCFGALWTAGVHHAQHLAPSGLEATGQSLFSAAVFGLAVLIANTIGGMIYQRWGVEVLFGSAACIALLGALSFVLPEKSQLDQH